MCFRDDDRKTPGNENRFGGVVPFIQFSTNLIPIRERKGFETNASNRLFMSCRLVRPDLRAGRANLAHPAQTGRNAETRPEADPGET